MEELNDEPTEMVTSLGNHENLEESTERGEFKMSSNHTLAVFFRVAICVHFVDPNDADDKL